MADLLYGSPAALRAEQDRRLRHMVELAAAGHPAYRRRWRDLGLAPGDIRGVDDLERLPLTDKQSYMAAPEEYRLDLADLPLPERILWDVVYTTGTTTGQPTPFYQTTYDHYNILELQRRMAAVRGMYSSDIIANLYPLTSQPHGAFLRTNYAALALGAQLVAGFSGNSFGAYPVHRHLDEVVDLVAKSGATVLWGVPSYLRRVVIRAGELGVRLPAVRFCAVSGEPLSESLRADLKQRLVALGAQAPMVNNSLGATEMQGGLVECCEGSGFHNPAPDLYYLEAVDETGRRVSPGQPGLLALTHLDRRGTVLLRYLTGDLVVLDESPCPHCGRIGGRVVSQPIRTGNLVKVRGMLVNTNLIGQVVAAHPAVAEYQVVLTREDPSDPNSMDRLLLRLALNTSGTVDAAAVAAELADAVRGAVAVRPEIEFVPAEAIFDPRRQMKPTRLVDRRSEA